MCRHAVNELPDELVGQFINLSSTFNSTVKLQVVSTIKESTVQSKRTTPRLTPRALVLLKHPPCIGPSEISDTDQVKGALGNNMGQGARCSSGM